MTDDDLAKIAYANFYRLSAAVVESNWNTPGFVQEREKKHWREITIAVRDAVIAEYPPEFKQLMHRIGLGDQIRFKAIEAMDEMEVERDAARRERDAVLAEYNLLPLTTEQAEAELAAVQGKGEPLSEERITEMVKYATGSDFDRLAADLMRADKMIGIYRREQIWLKAELAAAMIELKEYRADNIRPSLRYPGLHK